jgi:hypothetical protein
MQPPIDLGRTLDDRRRDSMAARVICLAVLCLLTVIPAVAQTAPCGRTIVAVAKTDKAKEERFLPAPPEHVKACTLRALPAVAAHVDKDNGLVLKVVIGRGDWLAWLDANRKAGVKGLAAGTVAGSYAIELRPETRDGIAGTSVSIAFSKIKVGSAGVSPNGATQLMEEIGCLTGLLSQSDPLANPRGFASPSEPTDSRPLTLPEGTPLQVILRDPLSSKEIANKETAKAKQILFEVAADVCVDGVPVIRKGALGLGRFTADAKAAGRAGRSADLRFVVDSVTAVDGQLVPVTGAVQRQNPRNQQPPPGQSLEFRTAALFVTGWETIVRAGTTADVAVSERHSIKVGK